MRIPPSRSAGALAAFALAIVLSVSAFAAELMPLSGRVVDQGDLLDSATEASLTATLAAFEQKSSDQIVVATIEDLGGESIEEYANRQFRAWGLGQAGENNGVLLLVAKNDRKMRIEVGYGLEGILTDLLSSMIIQDTMVPQFRAGNFAGGITGAVDDIIKVLEGDAAELEARQKRYEPTPEGIHWEVVLFIGIWMILFFGSFAMALLAPVFGKKLGPNRYRWLGMEINTGGSSSSSSGGYSSGGSSWSSGSSSSSSSGSSYSGGGGSSGGGGASGSW